MKFKRGIVHFYTQKEQYEHLCIYYSSPNKWEFSMMTEIDVFEKEIIRALRGCNKEDSEQMSDFKNKELDSYTELSIEEDTSIIITKGREVLDKYIEDNSKNQNSKWRIDDLELMKLHIESTLTSRNVIHDVEYKSLESIIKDITDLGCKSDADSKEGKLICGICDDIDLMRMKDDYELNLNGEEIIHGYICISYEHAKRILDELKDKKILDELRANRTSNIEIIDNQPKEIKSPLIFAFVK